MRLCGTRSGGVTSKVRCTISHRYDSLQYLGQFSALHVHPRHTPVIRRQCLVREYSVTRYQFRLVNLTPQTHNDVITQQHLNSITTQPVRALLLTMSPVHSEQSLTQAAVICVSNYCSQVNLKLIVKKECGKKKSES